MKTGIGRAGHLFAVDRWGVEPDLICLGKALGGGAMPIGALLGSERALGGFDDVPTGSTWAWLPGSCAAALATLDAFAREPVLENVRELERVARGEARWAARALRARRRRARRGLLPGDRVRSGSRDPRARPRAAGRGVAASCLRRGVIADSSTTSLNIQPSLVMPPARLERVYALAGESIEAALGG